MLATPASGQITTLDAAGSVGEHPAVAIGADGLALISYYDRTNGDLKVAHCSDAACGSATLSTVDSAGDTGDSTSITIGGDGRGLIAYQDLTAGVVKVAHCQDLPCSTADITTLGVGVAGSVATGADGLGLVAWESSGALIVTHCQDAPCSTHASTGHGPSDWAAPRIAMGPDGLGLVVWTYTPFETEFRTLHCADVACASATTAVVLTSYPTVGYTWHRNLAFGGNGRGFFTYLVTWGTPPPAGREPAYEQNRMAVCTDPGCSQIDSFLLPSVHQPSLAVGPDGFGLLADAFLSAAPLRIHHCENASCDLETYTGPIDSNVDHTALSVGQDGFPVIAYHDAVNADLKLAHCQAEACGLGQQRLSIGDVTVVEGDSGLVDALLSVSLSAPSLYQVSVDWQTYGILVPTATPGIDFVVATGTVVFAAGETTQTVIASVIADTVVEPDEFFPVEILNPIGATLEDNLGVVTISDDDAPSLSFNELAHGSTQRGDLQAQAGPVADVDYYRLAQSPFSSWEVVVDGASGDVVPVILERLAADNVTVLQTATTVSGGSSVSLRWSNDTAFPVLNQQLSVRSGGCGTTCDASAVYRARAYETTGRIARFNNSATQITVAILANTAASPAQGTLRFWGPGGTLVWSQPWSLGPQAEYVLNSATIPALVGVSGSITGSSDGSYGRRQGKAVAVEPASGFTFDTPLTYRPR